ncbi:MAG: hypothetical protein IJF07_05260 [Lachnospiraceae bacterium]|nr:hypothetical protein [Lachnospiraceae bacterium]
MSQLEHKLLSVIMGVLLIVSMFFVGREAAEYVAGRNVKVQEPCVVLDAGHGGTSYRPKELYM